MIEARNNMFKVISHLLGYPDTQYMKELPDVEQFVKSIPLSAPKNLIVKAFPLFNQMSLEELQQWYVSLFDFSESTSLYLTAQEFGDGRDRGQALVELRRLLHDGGFEELGGELPDYIPLLFEFLAVKPDALDTFGLETRLAASMGKMKAKLDETAPYYYLFAAVEQLLPEASNESTEKLNMPKEEVDLGEMPYPLYYEH